MKGLEGQSLGSGAPLREYDKSASENKSSDYGRVSKRPTCETWNLKYQE